MTIVDEKTVPVSNTITSHQQYVQSNESNKDSTSSVMTLLSKLHLLVESVSISAYNSSSNNNKNRAQRVDSSLSRNSDHDFNRYHPIVDAANATTNIITSNGSASGSCNSSKENHYFHSTTELMKPRPLPEAAKHFSAHNCVTKLLSYNNPYFPNASNSTSHSKYSRREADLRLARDIILFVQEMRSKG